VTGEGAGGGGICENGRTRRESDVLFWTQRGAKNPKIYHQTVSKHWKDAAYFAVL
jgi:hypothetical protein